MQDKTERRYSIGDVSKICGVPEHTLRFWGNEFPEFLTPDRTSGGQRRYSDEDIKNIERIKKALWVDNFSVKGARKVLSGKDAIFINKKNDESVHLLAVEIAKILSEQMINSGKLA